MPRSVFRPGGVGIGIIAAAPLLLAGCYASMETSTGNCGSAKSKSAWNSMDTCVLEGQVQSQVFKQLGRSVPPISCPNGLNADVGAQTVCTFTDTDGTFNVTVTVTAIDWGKTVLDDGTPGNFVSGNAKLNVDVADKPNT